MKIAVTTHAKRRLKERCGINKGSAAKVAEKAFHEGISFQKANDELKRYISRIYLSHNKVCNNLRIYNNTVYVFDNLTLVTVFPLPKEVFDEMEELATSIDKAADTVYNQYYLSNNNKTLLSVNCPNNTNTRTRIVKISDIVILPHMKHSYPKTENLLQREKFLETHGKIKNPIVIDSNNNLIDGYIDYILAIKKGYSDVICAIDDTYESSAGKTDQRLKYFILQDKKCAICGKSMEFNKSSLVSSYNEKVCICPKCRITYGMLNQCEVEQPIEMLRDLRKVLHKQRLRIKKFSIFTDDIGKYIQLKIHQPKFQSEPFEKLSSKYNIRIRVKAA